MLVILALLAPLEAALPVVLAVLLGGSLLTYYKSWKWFKEKGSQENL